MKAIFFAVVFCLVFYSISEAAYELPDGTVTCATLDVRRDASGGSAAFWKLKRGASIKIKAINGEFYKVKLTDDHEGYVHNTCLDVTVWAKVMNTGAWLHKMPDSYTDVVADLRDLELVRITNRWRNWYEVTLKDRRTHGWVEESALQAPAEFITEWLTFAHPSPISSNSAPANNNEPYNIPDNSAVNEDNIVDYFKYEPDNKTNKAKKTKTKRRKKILTPVQIKRNNVKAIVEIISSKEGEDGIYLGTGFLVNSNGVIITNYHVIKESPLVGVKLHDGSILMNVGLIWYDEDRDIAIIKVKKNNLKYVSLGDSDAIETGEEVVVIGNPEGFDYTVSDGLISNMHELLGNKVIQISAPVSNGSSGSPVFDKYGDVIGIVKSMLNEGQNINFAVPINEAKSHINKPTMINLVAFYLQNYKGYSDSDLSEIMPYLSKEVGGGGIHTPDKAIKEGNADSNTTQSANTSDEYLQIETAYAQVALYYNNALTDAEARYIGKCILYYSNYYKLDPRLLMAVVVAESRFKADFRKNGKMGLFGLQSYRAEHVGITDAYDVQQNIMGGAKLLKEFFDAFQERPNQIALMLASFYEDSAKVKACYCIPEDAQTYVAKITSLYGFFVNGR